MYHIAGISSNYWTIERPTRDFKFKLSDESSSMGDFGNQMKTP